MPNLIGGIVLGYIWQLIFNGILAKYSTALALNQWLGFWGLIILVSWQQIGYMMIIYIAGLQSIPGDLSRDGTVVGARTGGCHECHRRSKQHQAAGQRPESHEIIIY